MIITADGFILTNMHVVQDAKTIQVMLSNGKSYGAYFVRASSDRDLAVIKVNASGLTVPAFGDSDRLQPGQTVIAIGNPEKLPWTVTKGIVSALNRDVTANNVHYRGLIQTDAAINPGSPGGALVNLDGEVVGINTCALKSTSKYPNPTGFSFAIPINQALDTAKLLMQGSPKPALKPWIGVTVENLTRDMADVYNLPVKSGVLVKGVDDSGPAAKAGIQEGDIITELNSQKILSVDNMKAILSGFAPGSIIELTIWHQGKKNKVNVTVENLAR